MSLHETPAGAGRAFAALEDASGARFPAPASRRDADDLDRRLKRAMRQLAAQGAEPHAPLDVAPSLRAMAALLAETARVGAGPRAPAAEGAQTARTAPSGAEAERLTRRLDEVERALRAGAGPNETLRAALLTAEKAVRAGRLDEAAATLDRALGGADGVSRRADAGRAARRKAQGAPEESGLAAAAREMGALRRTVAALAARIEAGERAGRRDFQTESQDERWSARQAALESRIDAVAASLRGTGLELASLANLERAMRGLLGQIERQIGTAQDSPAPESAEKRLQGALDEVRGALADIGGRLARMETVWPAPSGAPAAAAAEPAPIFGPLNESARFAATPGELKPHSAFSAAAAEAAGDGPDILLEPGSGRPSQDSRANAKELRETAPDEKRATAPERHIPGLHERAGVLYPESVAARPATDAGQVLTQSQEPAPKPRGRGRRLAAVIFAAAAGAALAVGAAQLRGGVDAQALLHRLVEKPGSTQASAAPPERRPSQPAVAPAPQASVSALPAEPAPAPATSAPVQQRTRPVPTFSELFEPPPLTPRDAALRALSQRQTAPTAPLRETSPD